jgi:hypothetical protein
LKVREIPHQIQEVDKPSKNIAKPLDSVDLTDSLIGLTVFFSDRPVFVYFPFPDTDRISIKKWKFGNNRLIANHRFFFFFF